MLAARDLALYYRGVILPERTQILDQTLRQHNAMLKGVYDLLLAKQAEVSTEKAYVEAWRDYWIARAQLERAVGGRLLPAERCLASTAGPSGDGSARSDSQEGAEP
jgi:cobalt-zinc-cadmium efflux system outer membrane protein